MDKKQSAQAAADAAAMAAASDLLQQATAGAGGYDASGTARASALATAAANGFNNDGITSVVTVNMPPTSGNFSGKAGYAEVIVKNIQKRAFSLVFGSADLQVSCRAVGCGKPGSVGILLLDPNVTTAAQICGNMQILNDGVIYCNSDCTVLNDEFKGYGYNGVYLESTTTLSCGGISIVGKVANALTKESGASLTYTNGGSLTTGVPVLADPLAGVPEPVPTGTNYGNKTFNDGQTMQPGMYGTISIAKNADVVMAPGIYYIDGGLTTQSGCTLTGSGVMIYNTSGDSLKFDGGGTVYLTPPTSGDYAGISIFEPRSETKEVHIKSKNDVTFTGTLYAQNGEFDLRPGPGSAISCGNYICGTAEWSQGYSAGGSSSGTIIMNPLTAVPTERPKLVE